MKRFKTWLLAPATVTALLLSTGTALSQSQVVTPIAGTVELEGLSGGGELRMGCANAAAPAGQIRVTESYASLDIVVEAKDGSGNRVNTSTMTLMIDGPGFSECLRTDSGLIEAPGLLDRGVYNIYVGDSGGNRQNYELTISQN
ncbi:MAG: hypothetical protein AAGF66_09970 [Cyanobacteria bacterium P01_H01_bin.119]